MDRHAVAAPQIVPQLADCFDERQRFDVADRAADFAQHEVDIIDSIQRKRLDGIGDMRNDLHRCPEIIAFPFPRDDLAVDTPGGDIVRLTGGDAGEPLIMTKIEVRLRPVIGDIDLAVLIGRHRARINVEIGIELADADRIATRLQESGQRCRHQPFAE